MRIDTVFVNVFLLGIKIILPLKTLLIGYIPILTYQEGGGESIIISFNTN